jgi:uncharacterized protein YecT (DUF1311 family)
MLRAVSTFVMISLSTVAFAQDDFKSADSELNRLYKEITARLAGDDSKLHLLTVAQRGWIAFRDAECTFSASGVEGGSAYPEVLSSCKAVLTQKRIADFKSYLACQEGDLGCPVPSQ